MYKYINKYIKRCPPAALDTSSSCWVVQHKITDSRPFRCLPVARYFHTLTKWCYHKKGFMCLTFCVLRAEHLSSWVDTLKSAENPCALHEDPLQSSKTGVWCAVSRKGNVGPLLFEEKITAEKYADILTQLIALPEKNGEDSWFQQDGGRAQTN